ncbi:hypothetical protein FRB99_001235 [Tulasnella sp. 403]|nr:hypothetical protein FRB99_001235 [Tulasnella sp. 403]
MSNQTAINGIPSVTVDADVSEIFKAISSVGFLSVESPPIPSPADVARMFEIGRDFFLNESLEEKEKVGITTGNVGWVKMRQEKLDAQGYPGGDIKEAYNMRLFDENNKAQQPLPPLLAAHEDEIAQFMRSCHGLCMSLLRAFARAIELPDDFFTSRHPYDRPQGSILRLLYYPPTELLEAEDNRNDIRAGAHSDYGSLTLLFQKDVGGLQILLPSSPDSPIPRWLNAPVLNDSVLVNIGDLMEFWTGGQFKSTMHRVALPRTREEAGPRFSIAFFLHPDDDVLISRLTPTTLSNSNGAQEANRRIKLHAARFGVNPDDAPVTAKEWLLRRLSATYTGRREE